MARVTKSVSRRASGKTADVVLVFEEDFNGRTPNAVAECDGKFYLTNADYRANQVKVSDCKPATAREAAAWYVNTLNYSQGHTGDISPVIEALLAEKN